MPVVFFLTTASLSSKPSPGPFGGAIVVEIGDHGLYKVGDTLGLPRSETSDPIGQRDVLVGHNREDIDLAGQRLAAQISPSAEDLDLRPRSMLVSLDEHQVTAKKQRPEIARGVVRCAVFEEESRQRFSTQERARRAGLPMERTVRPGQVEFFEMRGVLHRADAVPALDEPSGDLDDDARLAALVVADERDGRDHAVPRCAHSAQSASPRERRVFPVGP